MTTTSQSAAASSPPEGLLAFRAGADAAWSRGAAPLPDVKPSAWAEGRIVLPPPASRLYHASEAPYQPGILDAVREPGVSTVVLQTSAQIGKTTVEAILCGYYAEHRPSPILCVLPSLEDARDYKDEQLGPMFEETPELAKLVLPRDNTKTRMRYRGGYLALVGANSHSGLGRRTVRFVLADEVDKWKQITGAGGDQITRLRIRLGNVPDGVLVMASTPLEKGLSVIEANFLRSDQRRYFIPCPSCNAMQILWWRDPVTRVPRLVWDKDSDGRAIPGSERYSCEACDRLIEERWKQSMLQAGVWRPTAIGVPGIAGFAINQLYSPWRHWLAIREQWEEAKGRPTLLRVFINEVLGESFEEDASAPPELGDRREQYEAEVPAGVGVLVASVDTQDSWLEAKVVGYGAGEESWLIAHQQFVGDPGKAKVWLELDEWLQQRFLHEGGAAVGISATCIDSGGHHSDAVYKFCKARFGRKIVPIRGGSDGRDFLGMPSRNNSYRVPLYTLNVDAGKDVVFSRMRTTKPGPEFMHLPNWVDDEYLDQLAKSEKKIPRTVKGRGSTRVYVKLRERNEALDLEVYALAALYTLGPVVRKKLGAMAAALVLKGRAVKSAKQSPAAEPKAESMADVVRQERKVGPRSHRGKGWASDWRR